MKKAIALILALVMVISLFSCSDSTENTKNEMTDEQEQIDKNKNDKKDENDKQNKEKEYVISHIDGFYNGIARFKANTGYGYMDVKGNVVVEPIYENAANFNEGLARVKLDGKYGYINTNGKVVVDLIYDDADEQFSTLASVTKDNKKQYINTNGKAIYTFTGEEIAVGEYSNGFFWVETEEVLISGNVPTMTYYDKDGKVAFSIENAKNYKQGNDQSSFNEWGYAVIKIAGDSGDFNQQRIIRNNGVICNWRMPSAYGDYTNVYRMYNHYISYQGGWNSGVTLYWDFEYGTWILEYPQSYFSIDDYSNGWVYLGNDYYYCSRGDLYGKTYPNNDIILQYDYPILVLNRISAFSNADIQGVTMVECEGENYFAVQLRNASNVIFYSLIDIDGNVIIQPTYKCSFMYTYEKIIGYSRKTMFAAYSFNAGLCKAQDTETKLFGFIDLDGNWVIQPQYKSVTDFYEQGDNAYAVIDGLIIINQKGDIVYTAVQPEVE